MSMTETATTTAPTLPPSDLTVGKQVDIESRTWAGINKPGGHATITKIHTNNEAESSASGSGGVSVITKVDVKYVLGGIEKDVELTYIKAHVELPRGGRRRRNDVKMNVNTLGGVPEKKQTVSKKKASKKNNDDNASNKKRKALADVDGNNGKIKAAKKSSSSGVVEEEVGVAAERGVAVVVPVGGDDVDGKWTLIQVCVCMSCHVMCHFLHRVHGNLLYDLGFDFVAHHILIYLLLVSMLPRMVKLLITQTHFKKVNEFPTGGVTKMDGSLDTSPSP